MSEILAYTSLIFNKVFLISRHGHIGQGQRIDTAKPGLRTGEVALHPGLGLLVLRQPDKQARARGKQDLINITQCKVFSVWRGLFFCSKSLRSKSRAV